MTWTPIRNKTDAAFRAAVALVFIALITGTAFAWWMLWPALPANMRGYVIAFACGAVLGRVTK